MSWMMLISLVYQFNKVMEMGPSVNYVNKIGEGGDMKKFDNSWQGGGGV